MKKIFLKIAFLFFVSCSAKAQTGSIYNCPYLKQYEGEWRYVNGIDTIKVYFRVHRTHDIETNNISDDLIGWHEYKHGNTLIESNYQNRFETLYYEMDAQLTHWPSASIHIWMVNCGNEHSYRMEGIMADLTLGPQWSNGFNITIDPSRTMLTWKMWPEHRLMASDPDYMTLPSDFVLVKQ